MTDQADDVNGGIQFLDGIQILAIGIPVPGKSSQDGMGRNVFHRFHHASQQFFIGVPDWRKRDTTVTHQGSGHTVPGCWRKQWIPADLRIKMRMQINKSRADNVTCCVYFSAA